MCRLKLKYFLCSKRLLVAMILFPLELQNFYTRTSRLGKSKSINQTTYRPYYGFPKALSLCWTFLSKNYLEAHWLVSGKFQINFCVQPLSLWEGWDFSRAKLLSSQLCSLFLPCTIISDVMKHQLFPFSAAHPQEMFSTPTHPLPDAIMGYLQFLNIPHTKTYKIFYFSL